MLEAAIRLIENRLQQSNLEYTVEKYGDTVYFSFNEKVSLTIYQRPKSLSFKVLHHGVQDFHRIVKSPSQLWRKINEIVSDLSVSLKYTTNQKGGNDG